MRVEKIVYSSHFIKQFKKLPKDIQQKAIQHEEIFIILLNDTVQGTKNGKLKKVTFTLL